MDGEWWDLSRPFVKTCEHLEFFKFDTPKGKEVYWHTGAHIHLNEIIFYLFLYASLMSIICILAQSLERRFGATIAGIAPTEDGFYVDALLPDNAYAFFFFFFFLFFLKKNQHHFGVQLVRVITTLCYNRP